LIVPIFGYYLNFNLKKAAFMARALIATIKRTFAILSATLIVIFLSGCGGDGGDEVESSNYPESLVLVDAPPSALDKKVTYSIAFLS
jgi:hypothetical protein